MNILKAININLSSEINIAIRLSYNKDREDKENYKNYKNYKDSNKNYNNLNSN